MLIALAWRNLWRNPFRSLILMASVALGLWAGLFVMAFYRGMTQQSLRAGIREISQVQIHAPGFKQDYRPELFIPGGDTVARELRSDPGVLAVAARSLAQGMLSTARGAEGVEIRGVDPEREQQVMGLRDRVREGSTFSESASRQILVGEKLARKSHIRVRSKVVLTFQDARGDMAAAAFRVIGIYKTPNARLDERVVFIPRAALDSLLRTGGAPHEIALLLSAGASPDSVAAVLRSRHPTLQVETWKQVAPELELIASSTDATLLVFMFILMLGLAFGLVNSMLMAVLDRTRELGMLMALGMNRRKVFFMILVESALLFLAGAPVGAGLAALTVSFFHHTGIDLSWWAQGLAEFGMESKVYPELQTVYYLEILAWVGVTAVLSALYPARKAVRLNPVEALRAA